MAQRKCVYQLTPQVTCEITQLLNYVRYIFSDIRSQFVDEYILPGHLQNEYSVNPSSGRQMINPRSSHTKDWKNAT